MSVVTGISASGSKAFQSATAEAASAKVARSPPWMLPGAAPRTASVNSIVRIVGVNETSFTPIIP
jgi:hypothetical protein